LFGGNPSGPVPFRYVTGYTGKREKAVLAFIWVGEEAGHEPLFVETACREGRSESNEKKSGHAKSETAPDDAAINSRVNVIIYHT